MNDIFNPPDSISEQVEYVETFQRRDLERIIEWVDQSEYDSASAKDPPPIELRDRAIAYIEKAIRVAEDAPEYQEKQYASWRETRDLYLGVGTELLLKAIILEYHAAIFVAKSQGGRSPRFDNLRKELLNLLSTSTSSESRKHINCRLMLIQKYRNDVAHLGLRRTFFEKHFLYTYDLIFALISEAFEIESDSLANIRSEVRRRATKPDERPDLYVGGLKLTLVPDSQATLSKFD